MLLRLKIITTSVYLIQTFAHSEAKIDSRGEAASRGSYAIFNPSISFPHSQWYVGQLYIPFLRQKAIGLACY